MSSFLLSDIKKNILVERLNVFLRYLVDHFDYYKRNLAELDLNINSLEDISKFPLLDKKEEGAWQVADEALAARPPAYFETSGTSGTPFPVLPDLGDERSKEFASFISEWLALDDSPTITRAVIALPFEMNPIGLKYFLALNHLGIISIPVGVRTHLCPPRQVLEIFERLKPELLIARPMEALRYAEAMAEQGKKPQESSIKKVILTGEIISESKFKRISHFFGGADVYSVYGLTELDSGGMVSCKKYQYHLPSKPYLLVELLDDDFKKQKIKDGDTGNIVLTNTNINFMPLLRYKTGDRGELKIKCNCGQFDTPVINLLGRSKDSISHDGQDIFPIHLENIILKYNCISSDYQVVKHGDKLSLRLEWCGDYNQTQVSIFIKQLQNELLNSLNINIEVVIFEPSTLVNRLGIAKSKAGTLHIFEKNIEKINSSEILNMNYGCTHDL